MIDIKLREVVSDVETGSWVQQIIDWNLKDEI